MPCGTTKKHFFFKDVHQKKQSWDFPDNPVFKSLPSNAGDTGSIPDQGTKIPHVAGQLSPHATMKDPVCSNQDPAQPNK